MKLICCLITIIISVGILSCKESPQPVRNDLSGSWVLYQQQVRENNSWVSSPIASTTVQTITFTYPHQVITTMVNDSILSEATYFEFGGGGTGVVGPYILFKKNADSPAGRMFYYTPGNLTDTLRLSEFGQAGYYRYYQYGFRRL